MATLNEILGGDLTIGGLLGSQAQAQAEQRAQNAALLNFGLNALLRSQGQPGQGRPGLGQVLAASGIPAVSAYQQSFDKTLQDALKGFQVKDLISKQAEAKRIQDLAPRLLSEGGGINQEVANQLMATPAGMDYLTKFSQARRDIAGKTELVEIFSPTGRAMKVRYNVDTGQYSPVGGEKAEPFVQVDRGNVIELRRPNGDVIGSVSKGAAPVAPSFSMTETGQVLNTKTGQLLQPRDAQGNPITIDTSVKATEDEKKSAGFYLRMKDATATFTNPILDSQGNPVLKDGKPVLLKDAAEKPEIVAEVIGSLVPRWMGGEAAQNFATSSVRQQYQQAQENWVTANLRAESGAVIGTEEMQKEIRKYFPQVGDSIDKIRQKEKSREVTEEAIRRRAGRAIGTQPSQQRNINVDY
jgi:hypothetical protein